MIKHFKYILIVSFSLSSVSMLAQNLLNKDSMFVYFNNFYKNDILLFKEPERNVLYIFNNFYNDNNFEYDFKMSIYSAFIKSLFVNENTINKSELVALVVYMMKNDMHSNIPYYKKTINELSQKQMKVDLQNAVESMCKVAFVDTREQMLANESSKLFENQYFVPIGCYKYIDSLLNK